LCAGELEDGDGQIPEGGHHLGPVAGAHLGGVFAIGAVAARGSCLIPSAARTCGGASATHSPTAASDCAPASTAATAVSNNDVRQAVSDPTRVSRIGHLLQVLQQAGALAGQQRAITGRQVELLQRSADRG
jgi:hypothetical protein